MHVVGSGGPVSGSRSGGFWKASRRMPETENRHNYSTDHFINMFTGIVFVSHGSGPSETFTWIMIGFVVLVVIVWLFTGGRSN